MNYNTIIQKCRQASKSARGQRCFTHAVIRIDGRIRYFNERQFRELQAAVPQMTDDEYQDFCDTVIIYNGPTVKKSTGIITINRNGHLDSPFQDGFLSYIDDLVISLLKWELLHQ